MIAKKKIGNSETLFALSYNKKDYKFEPKALSPDLSENASFIDVKGVDINKDEYTDLLALVKTDKETRLHIYLFNVQKNAYIDSQKISDAHKDYPGYMFLDITGYGK